jgi:hypothetical protein
MSVAPSRIAPMGSYTQSDKITSNKKPNKICYNEQQLIFYVIAIVILSIIAYCYFVGPKVYQPQYVDQRVNNEKSGYVIGGHLSAHSGTISASPY